ncbi:MAG TPA: hypothetical protein PLG90_01950 [Ignavibacteria bacterium]|nr:hypothetical protein [Ignavibacteria bacterium]
MASVIKKVQKKNIDDKKEELIEGLINVFENLGYEVRIEKGLFKGGFCLLREKKLFLLNKNLEQDKKISYMAKNLSLIGTEELYLKPNIREIIESETEG